MTDIYICCYEGELFFQSRSNGMSIDVPNENINNKKTLSKLNNAAAMGCSAFGTALVASPPSRERGWRNNRAFDWERYLLIWKNAERFPHFLSLCLKSFTYPPRPYGSNRRLFLLFLSFDSTSTSENRVGRTAGRTRFLSPFLLSVSLSLFDSSQQPYKRNINLNLCFLQFYSAKLKVLFEQLELTDTTNTIMYLSDWLSSAIEGSR